MDIINGDFKNPSILDIIKDYCYIEYKKKAGIKSKKFICMRILSKLMLKRVKKQV